MVSSWDGLIIVPMWGIEYSPHLPRRPGDAYRRHGRGRRSSIAGRVLSPQRPAGEGTAIDSVTASFAFAGIPDPILTVGSASDASELTWTGSAIAESYSISRGMISALAPRDYGACLFSGLIDTTVTDSEMPPSGEGFFYLLQGVSPSCGAVGTPGRDSHGVERVNANAAACN